MRITEQAHQAVHGVVQTGETVVDATAGNGHDTLFLARLVGPQGRVLAFDIQEAALAATRMRLSKGNIEADRVRLVCKSHGELDRYATDPIAAVMFNLGYLPGSDRVCRTTLDETVRGLGSAWALLRKGGILTVVCYRGHEGGAEEAGAVLRFAETRKSDGAALTMSGREESRDGPFLVALQKPWPS